jgi:hypothetical protein
MSDDWQLSVLHGIVSAASYLDEKTSENSLKVVQTTPHQDKPTTSTIPPNGFSSLSEHVLSFELPFNTS